MIDLSAPPPRRTIEIEALLAASSLALFAATTFIVLFKLVPAANEKYAMLLLGALIGIVKDTFARYFNVTKGAAEQRETIANLSRAQADTAAVAAAAAPPPPGSATITASPDVDVSVRGPGGSPPGVGPRS
jgi:hypothetical protein